MNKERIDELTQNYVWTIQNERDWYSSQREALAFNSYPAFNRATSEWITRVNRRDCSGEMLLTEERSFIAYTLLLEFMKERVVPSRFTPFLDAAEKFLQTIHGEIEPEPKPSNDAESITKEQEIMNTTAFATKHFIFGQDTTTMTEDQLIEAIKKIEAEIANLKLVKTASKKIGARVEELNAMLANVVAVLDAK
jgi:hypothetical protein